MPSTKTNKANHKNRRSRTTQVANLHEAIVHKLMHDHGLETSNISALRESSKHFAGMSNIHNLRDTHAKKSLKPLADMLTRTLMDNMDKYKGTETKFSITNNQYMTGFGLMWDAISLPNDLHTRIPDYVSFNISFDYATSTFLLDIRIGKSYNMRKYTHTSRTMNTPHDIMSFINPARGIEISLNRDYNWLGARKNAANNQREGLAADDVVRITLQEFMHCLFRPKFQNHKDGTVYPTVHLVGKRKVYWLPEGFCETMHQHSYLSPSLICCGAVNGLALEEDPDGYTKSTFTNKNYANFF